MTALDYTVSAFRDIADFTKTRINYLPYEEEFRDHALSNGIFYYTVITISPNDPEDIGNAIYQSVASYLSQNETTDKAAFVSSFNSATSSSFTAGTRKALYDKVQQALDNKQPLSGNLTDLAAATISGYAKTDILPCANASAMQGALGLGTAATHAHSDYAPMVHSHTISGVTGLQTALDAKADTSSLATVATSGSYNDLSNKPSIPSAQIQSDWTQASSGSLDFIKNKPTIPAAQVQSDWTQSSSGAVDFIKNKPVTPSLSFNNTPGRSTTAGTGATGFQVSSTRHALVNYSVTVSTAVQIGVVTSVDGYVVLEIAATNSATAGDWVEVARTPQAQNIGLALALSSTQKGGGNLTAIVPAGYYVKIRTVNVAGTPTYTYNSGQEVLF